MNGFFVLNVPFLLTFLNLQLIVNVAPFLVVSMPPPGVHSLVPFIFLVLIYSWNIDVTILVPPVPKCQVIRILLHILPFQEKSVACIITWHSFLSKCLFPFKFFKTHKKNPKYTLDYYLSVFLEICICNAIGDFIFTRPAAQALLIELEAWRPTPSVELSVHCVLPDIWSRRRWHHGR